MKSIVRSTAGAVLCITLLVAWGCSEGASPPPANSDARHPKEDSAGEVWTCSMHPQVRQSGPGKCPICGMDLIREVSPIKAAKKKVKYACSMFCLPPMDEPGRCPICDMVMVPVTEEGGGASDDSAEATISLSPAARRQAAVETAPVERRFVDAEIRMVGKVDFDETRIRVITARVPGRLDRLYVDYTGVPVAKGDHLVHFYSPDLVTAQEELLQAVKGVKEAEPIGIAALREAALETVRTVRDKLLLWGLTPEQLDEIEGRGTPSDHITIFAPMGGVVIAKDAVEGMYVEMGTRIYTIADLSQVWVKLDAYESDLPWIRYGQRVRFEAEAHPGTALEGTIAFIDPVVDAKTRTIKVRVNVPNPEGRLKPNMFVRAVAHSRIASGGKAMDPALAGKWICPMHPEVVHDEGGECPVCGMKLATAESLGYVSSDESAAEPPLVIPAGAPLLTGKRAVAYVERPDEPGVYELRRITIGPRAGDHYLVLDGLHEGERVVVRGNFFIDSARQILGRSSMMNDAAGTPPPASHQHHHADGVPDGGTP